MDRPVAGRRPWGAQQSAELFPGTAGASGAEGRELSVGLRLAWLVRRRGHVQGAGPALC